MKLKFTKMQGAGNDFVVLDGTRGPVDLTPAQIQRLGDRRFGVGADQILMVEPSEEQDVDFGYRIFNGADGDEVEHCGNGARCFVRYVNEHRLSEKRILRVRTMNNTLELHLQDDGRVTVDMNSPVFDLSRAPFEPLELIARETQGFPSWPVEIEGRRIELAVLSMGNPHAVMLVDDVDAAPVGRIGPLVQALPNFPRQVNVGFMQVAGRDHVRLRVYERGAGETLACGTGACAAVVAGIRLGLLDSRVDVDARGGRLTIEWAGGDSHVMMTGPAETVFEGEIEL